MSRTPGTTTETGNNVLSGNPHLGPLQNNGGPTATHAPLSNSPLLDAGDNAATSTAGLTTDQRGPGFARVRDDGDVNTTQTVDIGAFEADPAVQDITDKSTNEDTPLTFTFHIGDGASAFDSVTATSGNALVLTNGGISVGADTASSRTLTLTPVANASGATTVTVTVTKTAGGSMADTFVLTVGADNDPPTVSAIAAQAVALGTSRVVSFTIGDPETAATALLVTAVSSNQAVVPDGALAVSSGGASRTLTITPAALGTATITVSVSDGTLTAPASFLLTVNPIIHTGDFNGDGMADITVYRPATGQWFIRGQAVAQWGDPGDVPVSGDYNGDGVEDVAVFRPSTSRWYVKNQLNVVWGQHGDIPVPGDFDGDGATDIAVYRPSTGDWLVLDRSAVTFGGPGFVPVARRLRRRRD